MRKRWAIYAIVMLGVCLLVGLLALPFFATRPLSKHELLHYKAKGH